jgi:hypothetical protein
MPPIYAPEMTLACRLNAALTQWTTAIQSAAMATLAVDRIIMLRQSDDPKADARNRLMKFVPALVWIYGTALVAPIVATSHIVGVRPFPDRLVTSQSESQDIYTRVAYANSENMAKKSKAIPARGRGGP